MDMGKVLIEIKGADETRQVSSFKYDGAYTIIKFTSGGSYRYSSSNVRIYKKPQQFSTKEYAVIENKVQLSGVSKILKFGPYIRVFFNNEYIKTYNEGHVSIEKSSLCDKRALNSFEYLKDIARTVGLYSDEGENILEKRYKKIGYVSENSVLDMYLKGQLKEKSSNYKGTAIYPFGFNKSQKQAVSHALNNDLSVIQGPPGTGKTQTILNILANAVINGESVAVVSGNNSATENVKKKLEDYELDFIAASLGNRNNKEIFIQSQNQKLPDMASWKLQEEQRINTKTKLAEMDIVLDKMLDEKNSRSISQQQLESIKLEYRHFSKYYAGLNIKDELESYIKITKSSSAMRIWTDMEVRGSSRTPLYIKLMNIFKYGWVSRRFYKIPAEQRIALCQNRYYSLKIKELESVIKGLSDSLNKYDFKSNMALYTELSMKLFKNKLYEMYSNVKERKKYSLDDLWMDPLGFIKDYPVILSTTYSLTTSLSSGMQYDYVIVDESSQVDVATGALALSCARKAVIVGDLMQLPNVVDGKQKKDTDKVFIKYAEACKLKEAYRYSTHSLLKSVLELFPDVPQTLLKEHYRCNPKIINFCNQKFYNCCCQ